MRAATKKWARRRQRADSPAFLNAYKITREEYVGRFKEKNRRRFEAKGA